MTDDERAVLRFEEQHPRNDRTKEAAVREALGVSWVRYRQLLLRLVGREDVQRSTVCGVRARAHRSFSTHTG